MTYLINKSTPPRRTFTLGQVVAIAALTGAALWFCGVCMGVTAAAAAIAGVV